MANAEGDNDVEDGEPNDDNNEAREMNDLWDRWEREAARGLYVDKNEMYWING